MEMKGITEMSNKLSQRMAMIEATARAMATPDVIAAADHGWTLITSDGFVFWQLPDGTYTDGDETYSAAEIHSNGRDS